jgi:hypothetical protein
MLDTRSSPINEKLPASRSFSEGWKDCLQAEASAKNGMTEKLK